MSDVILDPINNITASASMCDFARTRFVLLLDLYGSLVDRNRLTKGYNSNGDVTSITNNVAPIRVMLFDRFKSSLLASSGISANTNYTGGRPRAYCYQDADVVVGDFILINYNPIGGTYDEKYLIEEKELHEINDDCAVFFTLYLNKVS